MWRFLFIALVACGRLVETSPDASGGDSSVDADALLTACDRYYDAQHTRCGGARLPADENARVKSRFERACHNEVALAGSGVNEATLVACANALAQSDCELPHGLPAACDFRGTIAGGGACTDGVQCASGLCAGQQMFSPEGAATAIKCGTCAPLVGLGEVCGSKTVSAGCDASAICLLDPTSVDAGTATYRCALVTRGNVGASCDGLTSSCADGLYCAAETGQCEKVRSSGAPCGEAPSYPGGCVAPLACVGSPGSSTCASGSSGDNCVYGLQCNAGLACGASGMCGAVTWASAQQPCDDHTVDCLVGSCAMGSNTCPVVIADGQPCKPSDTCDTFADCFDVASTADSGFTGLGTCVVHDSTLCH